MQVFALEGVFQHGVAPAESDLGVAAVLREEERRADVGLIACGYALAVSILQRLDKREFPAYIHKGQIDDCAVRVHLGRADTIAALGAGEHLQGRGGVQETLLALPEHYIIVDCAAKEKADI